MAHGTPVGVADNDERYGAQGAFLIEAGISSSYHIANFFGLTEWIRQPKKVLKEASSAASREVAKTVAVAASEAGPAQDMTAMLWPLAVPARQLSPSREPRRRAIDVGAVITRALTAAGLMK
jgi:hypothetical protein